jgi:hypothetical protein
MAREKQGPIGKLGEALIKAAVRAARLPEPSSEVDPHDREEPAPGTGPEDKPVERESVEIFPLPHFG